ncbi:MAG: molybdopterin-dependent oxidoreductase [Candidatus Helarchaeota archaeon]|nr:molybdopterin-dependent oxidoreductase [Candidatus Helarchaeota archaeon]
MVIKIIKEGLSIFKKFTCPTCNSGCGLLIEVKNNKVISIKPDKDHPLSKGYFCPKGVAWKDVTYDEDRVQRPLKRVNDTFVKISWKQALHEIAEKLTEIREKYSPHSIAYYMGTNSLHHYAHSLFASGLLDAMGSKSMYNAASVDNNNHFVAQHFLYGSPIVMPIPDLQNTDLFIIFGSNPAVTHLSLAVCSNVKKVMKELVERGGEIYVIDPRKNKTAQLYANDDEHHIAIIPNTDAFLLLSMINIILQENLADQEFLAAHCTNYESLKDVVTDFTPELVEKICKIPAEKIYNLTHKFVQTKRALIYGRMGICGSTFSTLSAWAIEVLNILAGKLDRPGGKIFGKNIVNVAQIGGLIGLGSYDKRRSRIGNYPEVMGALPLGTLAKEILAKNVHALIISAGNPILSSPNSNEFKKALDQLKLCVFLDFYINETAFAAADYILPVRTPLENPNFHAIYNLNYQLMSHIEYVEAAVTPDPYGPKAEWEILLSLIRLMNLTAFGNTLFDSIIKISRFIKKKFDPAILVRLLLFLGQVLQGRVPYLSSTAFTLKKIMKERTIVLGKNEYGVLKKYLKTKKKKIPILNPHIEKQIQSCKSELRERISDNPKYKLQDNEFLAIGRRLLKTSNSWLHNAKSLWPKKGEPKLWVNTRDAQRLNLTGNEIVILENELGSVEVPILITDNIMPGVVSYPHGWGHKNPKLSFANEHPGANINKLSNSDTLDKLSGMPLFNGYKVRLFKA